MFEHFSKIAEEYGYLHCAVEDLCDAFEDNPLKRGYVVHGLTVQTDIHGKKIVSVHFYTRTPEGKNDGFFQDILWKEVEPYLRDYLPKRKAK